MAPIISKVPVDQAEGTAISSDLQAMNIVLSATDIVFRNLADEIMEYLPIIDVILFGSTSRSLHAQLTQHLSRAFHALLGKYFAHPEAFRDIMRDTGTILSGSSVLSFVIRDTHWTPGDLDIYCPSGDAGEKIREHLVSIEGFKLAWCRGAAPGARPLYASYTMRSIHRYEKEVECEGHMVTKLTLDIIESAYISPVKPVTHFHSTVVMNYLTADSVVVLYPSLTFARVGVRQNVKWAAPSNWEMKYTQRGFKFLEDPIPCNCSCRNRQRSTHDSATMRVVFGNREADGMEKERMEWQLEVFGPDQVWYGRTERCSNAACPYIRHRLEV